MLLYCKKFVKSILFVSDLKLALALIAAMPRKQLLIPINNSFQIEPFCHTPRLLPHR